MKQKIILCKKNIFKYSLIIFAFVGIIKTPTFAQNDSCNIAADFDIRQTTSLRNYTFVNKSISDTTITKYQWLFFPNSLTSTEINPDVSYSCDVMLSNDFSVAGYLTIEDAKGCKDTILKSKKYDWICPDVMPDSIEYKYDSLIKNKVYFISSPHYSTWYSWDFDDNSTSNEREPIHVYDSAGTYNVGFSNGDTNSCCYEGTSNKIVINEITTNINDIKKKSNNIEVFPNPTTGVFFLKINQAFINNNSSLIISDITGKHIEYLHNICSECVLEINLSKYEPDIYFLEITNANVATTIPIVLLKNNH